MPREMKVYHVRGIRHCDVVFAESEDDAIKMSVESGNVGDWEAPEAFLIRTPKDYAIIKK